MEVGITEQELSTVTKDAVEVTSSCPKPDEEVFLNRSVRGKNVALVSQKGFEEGAV